jgi:hypothetical protein
MLVTSGTVLDGCNAKNPATIVSDTFKGNRWKRLFTFAFVEVSSRTAAPPHVNHINRAAGTWKMNICILSLNRPEGFQSGRELNVFTLVFVEAVKENTKEILVLGSRHVDLRLKLTVRPLVPKMLQGAHNEQLGSYRQLVLGVALGTVYPPPRHKHLSQVVNCDQRNPEVTPKDRAAIT